MVAVVSRLAPSALVSQLQGPGAAGDDVEVAEDREVWHWRVTAGVVAVGIAFRLTRFALLVDDELEPDGLAYLAHARSFSLLRPWVASDREPLWIAVVKAVSGPFGYSAVALRALTLVAGVAALVLAVKLFRVHLGPAGSAVGAAILALHPLLIVDASSGLRESVVLLLILGTIATLHRPLAPAVLAGLTVGIRWELGLVLVAVVAASAWVYRRSRLSAPLVSLGVGLLLVGPMMWSNASVHGDPLWHSSKHAVFYRNCLTDCSRANMYEGERITWRDFYIDVLGPRESTMRIAEGFVRIPLSLAAATGLSVESMSPAAFGSDPGTENLLRGRLEVISGIALVVLSVRGIARRPHIGFLVLGALGTAGYAVVSDLISYRLVSFLVLPLAFFAGAAITRTPRGATGSGSPAPD